jgi:hypothetical protein
MSHLSFLGCDNIYGSAGQRPRGRPGTDGATARRVAVRASGHDAGGSATPRGGTGDDRMIAVVVP